jgi:hypothetical protein
MLTSMFEAPTHRQWHTVPDLLPPTSLSLNMGWMSKFYRLGRQQSSIWILMVDMYISLVTG